MPFLSFGFLGRSAGGGGGRGLPGKDGVTPHIGPNKHWFIGNVDTGIMAEGDGGQAITHVALQGNQLIFTHADTAKHAITLPAPGAPSAPTGLQKQIADMEKKLSDQGVNVANLKTQLGELSHRIDNLTGVYTYRGTTAPASYPADPKESYFLNIHNSPALVRIAMPQLTNPLNDGTVFFVNNENSSNKIILSPKTGESIDQAKNLTINPQQFVMLVKNGANWIKSAEGYIPSSLGDLINRVIADPQVSTGLHTNQQILDLINSWLANPTTRSNLDKIMTALGYQKKSGGGTGPHPDATQVYIGTGDDYPRDFSSAIGHYAPHQALVVNNLDQNPKKVWIAVPKADAAKISGIVANNGLPATWANKDATIDGNKWTIFLSPTPLADQHISFSLRWSV